MDLHFCTQRGFIVRGNSSDNWQPMVKYVQRGALGELKWMMPWEGYVKLNLMAPTARDQQLVIGALLFKAAVENS